MSARILSMGYHHFAAIGYRREPSDSCFLADLIYIGSSFRRFSAVERSALDERNPIGWYLEIQELALG